MKIRYVLLIVCSLIAEVWALLAWQDRAATARQTPPTRVEHVAYNPTQTQQTVEFWAARARRDPQGAIERALLAGGYLQRCRETGDIADAQRAEQAAHASLAIRSRYNQGAENELALSLFMQHRFAEAQAVMNRTGDADATFNTNDLQTRLLRVEIRTEIGDYVAADKALRTNAPPTESAFAKAVRARLLEMNGQPAQALALLRQANAEVDRTYETPPPSRAWFTMRVGDLQAAMGRAEDAERSYRDALAIFPRDYLTLTALTRLSAGRNDWNATIAWGQKAAEMVPNPEVIGLLGDAYRMSGNARQAQEEYHLVEAIAKLARAQGVVYDRQRAMFDADHGRHLDEALRLAKHELTVRHDVFAYDTLAWAYYKNGKLAEADAASRKAMERGTQDAAMTYHAARIAEARGDAERAKACYARALAINPYFHPFAPAEARARLARLQNQAAISSRQGVRP